LLATCIYATITPVVLYSKCFYFSFLPFFFFNIILLLWMFPSSLYFLFYIRFICFICFIHLFGYFYINSILLFTSNTVIFWHITGTQIIIYRSSSILFNWYSWIAWYGRECISLEFNKFNLLARISLGLQP